jgi:hypothetical protein
MLTPISLRRPIKSLPDRKTSLPRSAAKFVQFPQRTESAARIGLSAAPDREPTRKNCLPNSLPAGIRDSTWTRFAASAKVSDIHQE